jgi:formylglycine-generating enzyme required for sulfatase activity
VAFFFISGRLLTSGILLAPFIAHGQAPGNPAPHSLGALLDGSGFVRISPGEYTMGGGAGNPDEQPQHRVRISRTFEIGKFEVTQAQWNAVMRNPHSRPNSKEGLEDVNPSHFKGPSRPVENVSWDAVQHFIRNMNTRDTKHVYRLPTEAEWEYACRGGSNAETSGDLDSTAWYEPNSGGETHPVGQKAPNAWGLYDTIGNVLEWVQDWYGPDYYSRSPRVEPQGPASGSYKVYRGGGWLSSAKYCRPAFRGFDFPSPGYYSVGFRLVRTPK